MRFERKDYFLLKTAYIVKYKNKDRELERDWSAYKKDEGRRKRRPRKLGLHMVDETGVMVGKALVICKGTLPM